MSTYQELARTSPLWWVRLLGEHAHVGGATATRRLITMGGVLRGERVLDLGCFVGATVRLLAIEKECRAVGVDSVLDFLKVARESTATSRAEFAAARAERLLFRDGAFDAVVCEDGGFSLEETHRVLRRGGRFILQGPVPQILRDVVQQYRDYGFEAWWSEDMTDEALAFYRRFRNEFTAGRDAYVSRFGAEAHAEQLHDIDARIRPYEQGTEHHVRAVFTKEGPIHRRRLAHPKASVETAVRRRRHVTR